MNRCITNTTTATATAVSARVTLFHLWYSIMYITLLQQLRCCDSVSPHRPQYIILNIYISVHHRQTYPIHFAVRCVQHNTMIFDRSNALHCPTGSFECHSLRIHSFLVLTLLFIAMRVVPIIYGLLHCVIGSHFSVFH